MAEQDTPKGGENVMAENSASTPNTPRLRSGSLIKDLLNQFGQGRFSWFASQQSLPFSS